LIIYCTFSCAVPLALDHILHVLLRRPGNKMRGIAFRDGFDPKFVGNAMHNMPAT
jgi:hypothetical protein